MSLIQKIAMMRGVSFVPLDNTNLIQKVTGFQTVFTNEGTDFINYGRPSWAVNNLRPGVDEFKVKFKATLEGNTGSRTILAFGADSGSKESQQLCIFFSGGTLKFRVGGQNLNAGVFSIGDYVEAELAVSTTGYTATVNGITYTQNSIGSTTGSTNLYIGGRTNGSSGNYEGRLWDVKFSDGDNNILELFPLNGSPNGANGTTGIVNDGAPNTVWSYQLGQDESGNSENYVIREVSTGDIDLNPQNLAGLPYSSGFQTRATIATLYNGGGGGNTQYTPPADKNFKLATFNPATLDDAGWTKFVGQ